MTNTRPSKLNRIRKGWLLLAIVTLGSIALGTGASVVIKTTQGADFEDVFNEPARTAHDAAEIQWIGTEPLLRELEPTTIESIDFAWTRALSAVQKSATSSNTESVDVWFSGPAQEQVVALLATGAVVDGGAWVSHDVTPDFYSIDGQILQAHIDRTGFMQGEVFSDTVRVIFVLRDGNWRVEHLVRIDAELPAHSAASDSVAS